jgi:2-polyprenyl-6-hydroxyphenyl methylase/3-demethylubiquinone-9 3-methyltransferase
MPDDLRNDLSIYDKSMPDEWWSDDVRWIRTLKNMVPGRLSWIDRFIDWTGKRGAGPWLRRRLHGRSAARPRRVVTGIDPAAEAVAAARAHAAQSGRTIRYDIGVGEALPYADARFDAVVCVDVLEHVTDLDRVLAEMERVLRPGGLFLFDTINRNTLIARLATITVAEDILRLLPQRHARPGHVHQAR